MTGHEHNVSMAKFLPTDSNQLVSVSRDKTIKFWELETGYCVGTNGFAHSEWIRCVAIKSDGDSFATGSNDGTICVFKVTNNIAKSATVQITIKNAHAHHIETIAFPPKNLSKANTDAEIYLASGSRDKTVKLWNSVTGELMHCFDPHTNWVRGCLIHPTGNYIISCSDDKSIRVLDIANKRCLRVIEDSHKSSFIGSIAMHSSYPVMVSGGNDYNINVLSLR